PAKTMRRFLAGLGGSGDTDEAPAVSPGDGGMVDRLPEPKELPAWLSQSELDHYVAEFSRTGFTGGINWYRNLDRNWEAGADLAEVKVEIPSLFVGGAD